MALAAFFNAVMDKTGDTVAFNSSVFRFYNDRFWNREVSWRYAKKVFGWKFDAWHTAKSLMVCCVCLCVVIYRPVFDLYDFFLLGAIWNVSFNLSYRLLKR